MYHYPKNQILVEQFGAVRHHQSGSLNYVLREQLNEFDKQYNLMGGRIGSLGHQMDRMEFARIVSEGLIRGVTHQEGILTEFQSVTEYTCGNLDCIMTVSTETRFGNDVRNPPYYPVLSLN